VSAPAETLRQFVFVGSQLARQKVAGVIVRQQAERLEKGIEPPND
jgi:hypothetical protein